MCSSDLNRNHDVVPDEEVRMRRFVGKTILAVFILGPAPYAFTVAELDPAPKNIKSMTVDELVKAGDERRGLRDYPEAVRYFREALRWDKKNASIYNKLGLAQMSDGDTDAARHSFERAVKFKPDFANAVNNLGVIHFNQKRLSAAAKYFKKAVELEETRASFHVNLGVTLFNQRKVEQAMKEYVRALELDPEVLIRNSRTGVTVQLASPDERAMFYFELAKILARRGDFEDCLRFLKFAKDNGYRRLSDVYRNELFNRLWDDVRLQEIVTPPVAK